MKKSIIYFLIGTVVSFLLNYYLLNNQNWPLELYYAVSFGLGWGLAYYVDHPEWKLSKKLGISFVGMFVVLILGVLLFNLELAIPSLLKFSTVFVAYYLFASFRESKSLRN